LYVYGIEIGRKKGREGVGLKKKEEEEKNGDSAY